MPNPSVVSRPFVLDVGSNLERLSPPTSPAKVAATSAWATMTNNGLDGPVTTGTTELLLGDLYAQTPAAIQNYVWPPTSAHPDTHSQAIYTDTLVWALYSQYQPVAPIGPPRTSTASAGDTQVPDCQYESTVSYVDATTGNVLFSEEFPPNQ